MVRRIVPFAIVLLAGLCGVAGEAPESATYIMQRVTATAVGSTAASMTYDTTVVMGQESPAGAASFCNTGFMVGLGFWSVLGHLPVPIVLSVAKNPGDPSVVELSWSGADDVFQVFRSLTPENVLDPMSLDGETPACAATDLQASAANLIFYKVIAKPGG